MMNKFTWGDSVRVKSTAPLEFSPNRNGDVVGFSTLTSKEIADSHGYSVGTVVYTIELGDGRSLEIPEKFLELDNDSN